MFRKVLTPIVTTIRNNAMLFAVQLTILKPYQWMRQKITIMSLVVYV